MNIADLPPKQPGLRWEQRPVTVVSLTTAVQAAISYVLLSLPVASVYYAPALGLPPWIVGFQISGIYFVAVFASLVSANVVRRFGGARTSQMALGAMGLGALCVAAGAVWLLVPGLVLMGLAYGLPNPAASHLLRLFTPPARRNLLFSIKQGGVPFGGMLGGICTAALCQFVGWQVALTVPAVGCLALALLLGPVRRLWDGDRRPEHPVLRAPLSDLIRCFAMPRFKPIFGAGVLLAAAQLCVSTFLVLLLVTDFGMPAIAAGASLSLVQGAGIFGRVGMGGLADWLRDGLAVLIGIATVLAALTVALALSHPPLWLLLPLLTGIGLLSSGWSGVMIAEADRCAPPEHASAATATLLAGTFIGVVTSTVLFSLLVPLLGTYRTPFLAIAAGCVVAGLLLWRARRQDRA
ncbi:MFS transporter [Pseudoroseicyclus sp. H15]